MVDGINVIRHHSVDWLFSLENFIAAALIAADFDAFLFIRLIHDLMFLYLKKYCISTRMNDIRLIFCYLAFEFFHY